MAAAGCAVQRWSQGRSSADVFVQLVAHAEAVGCMKLHARATQLHGLWRSAQLAAGSRSQMHGVRFEVDVAGTCTCNTTSWFAAVSCQLLTGDSSVVCRRSIRDMHMQRNSMVCSAFHMAVAHRWMECGA
jgi:hypothetical protein